MRLARLATGRSPPRSRLGSQPDIPNRLRLAHTVHQLQPQGGEFRLRLRSMFLVFDASIFPFSASYTVIVNYCYMSNYNLI
jgi:hypothetical protein